jgi:nitroreductase
MFRDLIIKNRSYRRFQEARAIDESVLRDLVELARFSPSGGNLQALKFMLSCTPERNALIFPFLAWAGYLADWPGPAEGERPSGYVIILGDKEIRNTFECDCGIAAQSIVLGAAERDIGGCMIGSIQRERLRAALDIPERYDIVLVIALGYPSEEVVLEEVGEDGTIEYWRDEKGVHHVPKRSLKELILD